MAEVSDLTRIRLVVSINHDPIEGERADTLAVLAFAIREAVEAYGYTVAVGERTDDGCIRPIPDPPGPPLGVVIGHTSH
jgi:hypothetical protein